MRGHEDPERNVGFCFLYYGGDDPEAAAERAVEVDGAEFRGKSLTVRLDDGRKGRARAEEPARWVEGRERRREPRSPWHKGRDEACRDFRCAAPSASREMEGRRRQRRRAGREGGGGRGGDQREGTAREEGE
jgi:hypothetical protein